MKISIITLAYNNNKCLADFLDSIKKFNDIGDELEIIIVDHNLPENSALGTLRTHGTGKCIYVTQDNRAGLCGGDNLGASLASGEILAFMNQDILLIEPVFGKAIEKFSINPNLGWLGGKILEEDGSDSCSYAYRFEYRTLYRPSFKWQSLKYNLFDERTMFLWGCGTFMRRKVFDLIGGYDENFLFCNEEADLVRKIHTFATGYTVEYHPDIRMVHLGGRSDLPAPQGDRIALDDLLYYCKKYNLDYRRYLLQEYKDELERLEEEKIHRPENVPERRKLVAYLRELVINEYSLGAD
ncbi:MAG: glycosyltransferase [Acidaminococcaceae bacterium]|nr:glycosyltransferase [Acidaminococcaceae bacterium]